MTDPAPTPEPARPAALVQMVHFITCRLAGIVPAAKLDELRTWREEQFELIPDEPELANRFRNRIRQRFFTEYDRLLDDSRDCERFLNKRLAAVVRRHLLTGGDAEYAVLSYTIMPNHVHLLVQVACPDGPPRENDGQRPLDLTRVPLRCDEQSDYGSPLVDFLLRFKAETTAAASALDGSQPLQWHDESFDYWIRTQSELEGAVDYVAHNPVSAGLVRNPEQWFFSSAHERFLHEGIATGWLPR